MKTVVPQPIPPLRAAFLAIWQQPTARHLTFAVFQRLMPDDMRATTLAIVMTLVHLISMGIGPQAIGALSDALKPQFGSDSLRYAMLIVATTAVFAGYQFWKSGHTAAQDLAEAAAVRSDVITPSSSRS